MRPGQENAKMVKKFPLRKNVKGIQACLGLTGYGNGETGENSKIEVGRGPRTGIKNLYVYCMHYYSSTTLSGASILS